MKIGKNVYIVLMLLFNCIALLGMGEDAESDNKTKSTVSLASPTKRNHAAFAENAIPNSVKGLKRRIVAIKKAPSSSKRRRLLEEDQSGEAKAPNDNEYAINYFNIVPKELLAMIIWSCIDPQDVAVLIDAERLGELKIVSLKNLIKSVYSTFYTILSISHIVREQGCCYSMTSLKHDIDRAFFNLSKEIINNLNPDDSLDILNQLLSIPFDECLMQEISDDARTILTSLYKKKHLPFGYNKTIKLCLDRIIDLNLTDSNGNNLIMQLIIEGPAKDNYTYIIALRKLLSQIVTFNFNQVNNERNTMLHLLCKHLPGFFNYALHLNISFFNNFLDVNAVNDEGDTPLLELVKHVTNRVNSYKVIKNFLTKSPSVDVNIIDKNGKVPLTRILNSLTPCFCLRMYIKLFVDRGLNIAFLETQHWSSYRLKALDEALRNKERMI